MAGLNGQGVVSSPRVSLAHPATGRASLQPPVTQRFGHAHRCRSERLATAAAPSFGGDIRYAVDIVQRRHPRPARGARESKQTEREPAVHRADIRRSRTRRLGIIRVVRGHSLERFVRVARPGPASREAVACRSRWPAGRALNRSAHDPPSLAATSACSCN